MEPGASRANTAASPSGAARMGVELSPAWRANSSAGATVGVPAAAEEESDVEPGVAVDEGVMEWVATTGDSIVGVLVAATGVVRVVATVGRWIGVDSPAGVSRAVGPPLPGVGVWDGIVWDSVALTVTVGDGVGHSTCGAPT